MGARAYPRPILLLVVLLLLAGACAVPTAPPPFAGYSTAASELATATPPPTQAPTLTATATATKTLTPTVTPTISPTVTPTVTPSPTLAATPTVTPCAEAAGQVLMGTFPSPTQGWDPPYRVYLPPCYGQNEQLYPALYLFHGNVYSESHWDDLGIDEAADVGITAGTLPPFVIVMPFGGEIANNSSGGAWSFEGVVLNDLIPYIEDRYCVWPEAAGRAIGGLSRGGYWSLEIGFLHPELFGAVGGHSAAIFPDNAGPLWNPLSTGSDPRLVELPIYLDIGEQDWLRQGVFDLHDVLTAAGTPHVWQVNPGAHGDDYWREHAAEYLAWYASHWPADQSGFPSAGGRSCLP